MKPIIVVLEAENKEDNVWARIEEAQDVIAGVGKTEEGAIEDLRSGIEELISFNTEEGLPIPEWYSPDMDFDIRYDISMLFRAFPFLSATEFARAIGVNASLMRQYKTRRHQPSAKQKARIQQGLDTLVEKLAKVRL